MRPGRSNERSFSMGFFVGRHTVPRVCISISSKTNDCGSWIPVKLPLRRLLRNAYTHACTVWRGEQATHSDCFTSWKNDHGGQSTDNYRCNNIWYILTRTRAWARGCGRTLRWIATDSMRYGAARPGSLLLAQPIKIIINANAVFGASVKSTWNKDSWNDYYFCSFFVGMIWVGFPLHYQHELIAYG